jgi:hypothetical protein
MRAVDLLDKASGAVAKVLVGGVIVIGLSMFYVIVWSIGNSTTYHGKKVL